MKYDKFMYNLLLLYVLKQQGTFTSLKAKGQPLHLCRRLIETLSVSKEKQVFKYTDQQN